MIVTASELGEYVYCPRAWWLNHTGEKLETSAMRKGIAEHNRLSRRSAVLTNLISAAIALIITGLLILVIATVYFLTH